MKAFSYYGRQKRRIAPFGSIMFLYEIIQIIGYLYLLRGGVWHITTNICKSGPKTAYETYANSPELWMYLHSKTNVLVYFSSTLTQRWSRWAGAHLGTRISVRIPWDAIVFEYDRSWVNDRTRHDLSRTAFKKITEASKWWNWLNGVDIYSIIFFFL